MKSARIRRFASDDVGQVEHRLMSAFLVGPGMLEGTCGKRARLIQAAGAQMRLAQGGELKRPASHSAARERPFEQPHGLVDTPAQDIRRA